MKPTVLLMYIAIAVGAAGTAAAAAPRAPAASRALSPFQLESLALAALAPARADSVLKVVEPRLAGGDATQRDALLAIQVDALVTLQRPIEQINAANDSLLARLAGDPARSAEHLTALASRLYDRPDARERALRYAQRARQLMPDDAPLETCSRMWTVLGRNDLLRNNRDSATVRLERAVAGSEQPQRVLWWLGQAWEKGGDDPKATDAYLRSVAWYGGTDSVAAGSLRAVYMTRFKSLNGLDEQLASMRAASRQQRVFDSRHDERPMPPLAVVGMDGKPTTLPAAPGKARALYVWGTRSPASMAELPGFAALATQWGPRAAFLAVCGDPHTAATADALKQARAVLKAYAPSLPAVALPDSAAVQSLGVREWPTVFVVDRDGMIRYRNDGFRATDAAIVEEQLLQIMGD